MIKRKYITATILVALSLVTLLSWIFYDVHEESEKAKYHKPVSTGIITEDSYNTFLDLPLEDLLNIVVVPEQSEVGTYDYYSNILVWNKDSKTAIIL